MKNLITDPLKLMHARLNLFSHADALKGCHELGSFYDPALGKVRVGTGKLKDFLANSLKEPTHEESMEIADLYRLAAEECRMGNTQRQRALNSMRVSSVDNYIRASGNWSPLYFEDVVLEDSERPVFKNTSRNEVDVHYISEDGSPSVYQAVKHQKEVYPDLHTLTSEPYGYPVRDVYQGDVSEAAKATVDIGFDLNAKVEALAKAHLDTAFGTFVTSGDRELRTYFANSHIQSANIPDTNDLVTPGDGANTPFRPACLIQVRKYCDRWGGVFSDGPLYPTGIILISSLDSTNLLEAVDPFGAKINSVGEGLADNYLAISYGNTNWVLVPDVTLAPNYAYPVLNKRLGNKYTKPSQDEEFVSPESAQERLKRNWEERSQQKVIGFAHAKPNAVNVCRVRYRTP